MDSGQDVSYCLLQGDTADSSAKARRLRHLPVEKGLLREVKQIQRVLDALVMCRVSFLCQQFRPQLIF